MRTDEIQLHEDALELSWSANAYLDCAIRLCDALIDDGHQNSVYDNRVVLHLVYLSVELNFKAGLAAANAPYPKHHDLRALRDAYASGPGRVPLELPTFVSELISAADDHFREFDAPRLDVHFERFRYNTDRAGRRFPRLAVVDLETLRNELDVFKASTLQLFLCIRGIDPEVR